mmetsp:Transcript_815/g.867  ORF Transcript_815/g.867 Transcript_815/m.867 type:complete len:224 (+) Transcript_815:363-1034(+)
MIRRRRLVIVGRWDIVVHWSGRIILGRQIGGRSSSYYHSFSTSSSKRIVQASSVEIAHELLVSFRGRLVVNVALLGNGHQLQDLLTFLRDLQVYILYNYLIDTAFICIALHDKFLSEKDTQLLSHIVQLIHFHPWSRIYNSVESGMHILGRAELSDLLEPTVELVAHDRHNIIARNQVLLIDQSLSPDLSIDFISCLQVLGYVIFLLGYQVQLLAPVNVYPAY